MGTAPTKYIDAYGWTEKDALTSLDALLAYRYNGGLEIDKSNGRHFVGVNGYAHYVELTKMNDKGPIRARFSI